MTHYYQTLFSNLSATTTLVTVNRRLSRFIEARYNEYQQQQGLTSWPSLVCLPLATWLNTTWQNALDAGFIDATRLLTSLQESVLWETILYQSALQTPLLRITETAQHIANAYQLLKQWDVNLNEFYDFQVDNQALTTWVTEFENYIAQHNLCDHNKMIDDLVNVSKRQKITNDECIYLIGFDQLSPKLQSLFEQIKNFTAVSEFQFNEKAIPEKQHVYCCQDQTHEIAAMVEYARICYKKNQTLACVVPDLANLKYPLIRKFCEAFSPTLLLTQQEPLANLAVNISIGQALSDYPIIDTALHLLNLLNHEIKINDISNLLRSPFIGGGKIEFTHRANLDAELRAMRNYHVDLDILINYAQQAEPNTYRLFCYSPVLVSQLQQLQVITKNLPQKQTITTWCVLFKKILEIFSWPGDDELTFQAQQTQKRFYELLSECDQLNIILNDMSLQQALNTITKLAKQTIFQATVAEKPIQIVGLLEAAGLHFDHIWVMGMDDENWPSKPNPNPFIPHAIQKKYCLPHSNAERELAFCQTITDRLLHSAETVIFSYHKNKDDHEQAVSPLLTQISLTHSQLGLAETIEEVIFSTQQLEWLNDEIAPKLAANEIIHGGTLILKEQAACPFRAFAHIRCHAQGLETPQLGLNAMERGTIIHRALEIIWRKLGDSERLQQLAPSQLNNIIQQAARDALLPIMQKHAKTLKTRFISLELNRIEKIITRWLHLEKKRPVFKVIAIEDRRQVNFSGLTLNLSVDRIDQLGNGSLLIIDYKTGKTNIHNWFGERLEEPQLPLYCITHDQAIQGISFAQVQAKEMHYAGIVAEGYIADGIKTLAEIKHAAGFYEWDQLVNQWQENLTQLAHNFQAGIATVDPNDVNKNCAYCDLQAFCRINEDSA